MFVSMYKTLLRTNRWYMLIFPQILDICVNKAWLLHKRHMALLNPDKKMKTLFIFL